MITIPTEARLNILLPNMNKALSEAIKQASPEQLKSLKEGKDIKSLLTSLFQDKITSSKSDAVLSDILKNSSAFKNMGNLTDQLVSLLKELKTSTEFTAKTSQIENFLKNISTLDPQSLKTHINNSGVFMESKIAAVLEKLPDLIQGDKTLLEPLMKEDLKANLLALSEELKSSNDPSVPALLEHVDTLLLQIDYHQLSSYLNGSNSLYIPFSWDQLQEGSIVFKSSEEKKFYCQIDLQLKEYGEINLMMGLYEENQLDVRVQTEKDELKALLHEHMEKLRAALIDEGLNLRSIRVSTVDEKSSKQLYEPDDFGIDNGFEVIV